MPIRLPKIKILTVSPENIFRRKNYFTRICLQYYVQDRALDVAEILAYVRVKIINSKMYDIFYNALEAEQTIFKKNWEKET